MQKNRDPVTFLWSLINQSNKPLNISEIKSISTKEGFDEKSVEKALEILYHLYLIEYNEDTDGNGLLIKKRDILGFPFDDYEFKCLGCEHLYECKIGFPHSPERCPYFEAWLQNVKKLIK